MRREVIGDCELWLGDCRELGHHLNPRAAIVSDPPYGMGWDTDCSRFSGGTNPHRRKDGGGGRDYGAPIAGDAEPFDPTPWLSFRECILWGANHFGARLPVGTTLIWIKRLDVAFGSFLSDAEVAWMKGGHGVYCRRDLTNYSLAGDRVHPSQKPVGIMEWCVGKTKADLIADPYMGSGSTALACIALGRRFIGIELDERHFETALRRIEQAYRQPRLFQEPAPRPVQEALLP